MTRSLCATLAACAWAACALCAAAAARAEGSEAAVWSAAGRQVLRLHGIPGGPTAAQRVETLDTRVNELLSSGDGTLAVSDIKLRTVHESVCVFARGILLVTVAQVDARANATVPERLGRIWLVNLQKVLPQLAPRENKGGA